MSSFAEMMSGDLSGDREDVAKALQDISTGGANHARQVAWLWQEVPVPVIAAVQDAPLGGGLNLALGADIRIVQPEAKMGFVEITFGSLPDMSASQSLRRLVSLDRMKELVLTGREFNGVQAISETPLIDALAMAQLITDRNPDTVRAAKRVLNQSISIGGFGDGIGIGDDRHAGIIRNSQPVGSHRRAVRRAFTEILRLSLLRHHSTPVELGVLAC